MGRVDGSEVGTSAWSASGSCRSSAAISTWTRRDPHLMASPLSSTSTSTSTSSSSESDELGARSSLSCERIVSKISSSPNSSSSRGGATDDGRRVVSMSPLDAVISPAPRTGARRGRPSPFAALREYRPAPPGTEELPVRTARIDSRFEAVLRARLLPRDRVCEFGWVRAPRSHFVVAFSAVEGAGERTGWESSEKRGTTIMRGIFAVCMGVQFAFFAVRVSANAGNLNFPIRSDSPRFYPVEALAQGSTVGAIVGGVARVESEVGRNLESLTEDLKDNFKKMTRYMFPDSTKIFNPSSERYYR